MSGRLERQSISENKIQQQLSGMPEYIQIFYEQISSKSYRTAREYLNYVNNFLNYLTKRKNAEITVSLLEGVTPVDISNYIKMISTTNRGGRLTETSTSYQATVWSAISTFFNTLIENGILNSENPCKRKHRPKVNDEIPDTYMTPDEIRTYLNTVISGIGSQYAKARQSEWKERDVFMMLLFISTGLRVSALCEIDIEDINLETKTLTVTEKGNLRITLSLSDSVVEAAEKWIKRRDTILDGTECHALFISNQKKRISYSAIHNLTIKYSAELQKHITPHKFRHSYGTNLYEATKDEAFVQECLHHASISTTYRYINNTKLKRQRAVGIMDNIITGNGDKIIL